VSIFKKAANAVKKAATTAANAVTSAVNSVAQAVSTVVEAAAEAVETAANAVANAVTSAAQAVADTLAQVPVIGGLLSGAARLVGGAAAAAIRWVGSVVSAVLSLGAAVIKAVGGLIGGVLGGLIRVIGGVLSLDWGLIRDGLVQIVSGIVGAVIVAGGKAIETVQGILGLQSRSRRLTDLEVALLRRVFWNALGLGQIRIVEGRAGLFGINSRAFVLGNTIYMKDKYNYPDDPDFGLLVHECIHVWQYQHLGSSYASDAVGAQLFVENEYSWRAEIDRGNEEWVDFNPEAQGTFFQNLYDQGKLIVHVQTGEFGSGTTTREEKGSFFDADGVTSFGFFLTEEHTARADRAVAHVRGARWMGQAVGAPVPPVPPIQPTRPFEPAR
jgi:hypothetical protein